MVDGLSHLWAAFDLGSRLGRTAVGTPSRNCPRGRSLWFFLSFFFKKVISEVSIHGN